MKKRILHIIYDLGRGGAETMLVRVIRELPEYEHIVVTFIPMNHFGSELQCTKAICFNFTSLWQLPLALFKIRGVVRRERPDMVHTHLFWPTVMARLALPRRLPLITTIHAFVATSVEYRNWHIRFLDKLTYRLRKSVIIVVAKGALEEYFSFLRLKPWKAYALYTFVDINRFVNVRSTPRVSGAVFKVVAVGALREQKNFTYLIKAFEQLRDLPVELDIYGRGPLQEALEQQLAAANVKVTLKGQVNTIEEVLPLYDLFVMPSLFEGFSLSVLEAMAMGMPLLLSDIASFREQATDIARYFSLGDPADCARQLREMMALEPEALHALGQRARERAVSHFTLTQHIEGLRHIYTEVLNSAS
jgi:glycosyltransferase involved in cell wall biosynthesis